MSVRNTSDGAELIAAVTPNDRNTLDGTEVIAAVRPNDRNTLDGAELIADLANNNRNTLDGTEVIADIANNNRNTLDGVELIVTLLPACTVELIENADAADVAAIEDEVTALKDCEVVLSEPCADFPNARVLTDSASLTWDRTVDGEIAGAVIGGGGSVPDWVTIDPRTEPASPAAADDEMGGASYPGETALDTGGTRRSGATGWGWRNQGTSAVSGFGTSGAMILTPQLNAQIRGVEQAVPAGSSWKIHTRIACRVDAPISNSVILGVHAANNANGKLIIAGFASISGGVPGMYSSRWNSPSSWSGDLKNPSGSDVVRGYGGWLEIEYNGTTIFFRVSTTGQTGSFGVFASDAVASHLGGLTHIGLCGYADGGSPQPIALVSDLWRQV